MLVCILCMPEYCELLDTQLWHSRQTHFEKIAYLHWIILFHIFRCQFTKWIELATRAMHQRILWASVFVDMVKYTYEYYVDPNLQHCTTFKIDVAARPHFSHSVFFSLTNLFLFLQLSAKKRSGDFNKIIPHVYCVCLSVMSCYINNFVMHDNTFR